MKKSKPRRWTANPLAMFGALDRVTLVKDAGSDNVKMRIVAHDALDMLRQGKATRGHLQMVIEAINMAETLAAQACVRALAERSVKINKYVLKGTELNALNLLMQIHDSQLDACSIYTLDQAVAYIRMRIGANQVLVLPTPEVSA